MTPPNQEMLDKGFTPTIWWCVVGADDRVWCETSNETEARARMRPGDRLLRTYTRTDIVRVQEDEKK